MLSEFHYIILLKLHYITSILLCYQIQLLAIWPLKKEYISGHRCEKNMTVIVNSYLIGINIAYTYICLYVHMDINFMLLA